MAMSHLIPTITFKSTTAQKVLLYQSNMFHCFMADNVEYEERIASESTLLYHQEDAS